MPDCEYRIRIAGEHDVDQDDVCKREQLACEFGGKHPDLRV